MPDGAIPYTRAKRGNNISLLAAERLPDTHIEFPVQFCPYTSLMLPKLPEMLMMEGSICKIEQEIRKIPCIFPREFMRFATDSILRQTV